MRVRKTVTANGVAENYSCPAECAFCGQIIALTPPKRFVYALAGDTYGKIAEREGADETALAALNGYKTLYPTLRVWLP